MTDYWFYDSTVYRATGSDGRTEAHIDGAWKPVVPSEQDYDHMRPIDEAEAEPGSKVPSCDFAPLCPPRRD